MASGSSEVQFQLNKNDQLYTNGYATKSSYAAQTINSLVDLRKGDKMYIKHRTGASQTVYGEHFSTFAGYLLSE